MIFLDTNVSEEEFLKFLDEMVNNNDFYSSDVKSFPTLTFDHASKILNSNCFVLRLSNIDSTNVKISIFTDDMLVEEAIVPVIIEILMITVFTGTTLFSSRNKTDISEINFISKQNTEIKFNKVHDGRNIVMEFT